MRLTYFIGNDELGRGYDICDEDDNTVFTLEQGSAWSSDMTLHDADGKELVTIEDESGWFNQEYCILRKGKEIARLEQKIGFLFTKEYILSEKGRSSRVHVEDESSMFGPMEFVFRRRERRVASLVKFTEGCCDARFGICFHDRKEDGVALLSASVLIYRIIRRRRKQRTPQ